jgi:PhnB protein
LCAGGNHLPVIQNPPPGYTRVCPYLLYEDAAAAVQYLTTTFGFLQRLEQIGGAGRTHTELTLGEDGLVMVGQAGDSFKSPRRLDVYPSVLVHLYVDDVDALHEQARATGANVTDLETAPVGDRRFTATDPEGQVWVFAQRIR